MHTVQDVKEHLAFAHQLGLSTGRLYTKIGTVPMYHAIYASPTDQIRSVLGKWGNEMFTSRSEAVERKAELDAKGLDTILLSWEAHGKESCKITPGLLRTSKTRFAYLIFHEGLHVHVLRHNWRLQPAIEEAVGDVFAYKASKEFFAGNFHMQVALDKDFESWMKFYQFGNMWLERLHEEYAKGEKKGRAILLEAENSAKRLKDQTFGTVRERLSLPINNAFFLRLSYYAPKTEAVAEALCSFSASDILNKERLYAALRPLKK